MPATVRYDQQYCPIARALDVLGDRWTLLILRELIIGDQRFTDLKAHLPGIAPTLLTQRLRTMAEEGLVTTKELPPPAARTVYSATERGRSVVPVMRSLAKWGMPLLEEPEPDLEIRPWTCSNVMIATYYDAKAAAGIDQRYLVRIDGEEFLLSSVRGRGEVRAPDLVLESGTRVWIDIRQGRTTLRDALADGRIRRTAGKASVIADFRRVFAVP